MEKRPPQQPAQELAPEGIEELRQAYFSEQPHEQDLLALLPSLLEGVTTFVDVGASLGQYVFFANQTLTSSRLFALEADPIRYQELAANCERWQVGSSNQLRAIHAAVSDQATSAVPFFTTDSSLSGGLFARQEQGGNWRAVEVPCVTLDELFADSPPDFVKIDVEGSEWRVIAGARRILQAHRTTWLLELHPWIDPEGRQGPAALARAFFSTGHSLRVVHGHCLFTPEKQPLVRALSARLLIASKQLLFRLRSWRRH